MKTGTATVSPNELRAEIGRDRTILDAISE
jgi:hypothetical protein